MGVVKSEDIVGVEHEGKVYCEECWEKDEAFVISQTGQATELKENEYILQTELDEGEDIYFCDDCGKEL